MQRQLSLFHGDTQDFGHLAGLVPTIRAAMNRAAGADEAGRKLLVDRINSIAASAGIRLTSGNVKAISKDTLDKWLAPGDRDHTPSILAIVVFCAATGSHEPLQVLLKALGFDVMTTEDRRLRDYGRACLTERAARKRKKALEESI
ncbi:hypothetical protein SAMN04488503_0221 [Humidesulfovibrio mexicanus]|uniref:Uncharacterized protein n=1 Tax=Humidesulfovibrio mexicanus TaxID=147047 RepID=A0A238XLA0_9BACT|nr:hypothetical protein [Humidesulfovibrio mexicanus]SNR59348.1 hypothetical protein SAMN04488503_0221 [Humidesulfovibrio mexicanus]